MTSRNTWVDQTKAVACLVIVLHHLVFYGPMADHVRPAFPALMHWLFEYGRMAVQVFLVLGGVFAAAAVAPKGVGKGQALWPALGKRYTRLVIPYSAALATAIVISDLVLTLGFDHASVSSTPTWDAVFAHLLLVHSIGGWESISAGVWYVAIDFQLYVLALLWFWMSARLGAASRVGQFGIVLTTAASLWFWNLDSALDVWALYFFGAYGMGMMAWWAARSDAARERWMWIAAIVMLGGAALVIEWRTRIALAWTCALLFALASQVRWPERLRTWRSTSLTWIGQRSYSIFLIHFPISLLVNAAFSLRGVTGVWPNALGMAISVVLSVAAGALLYRLTERPMPSWTRAAQWGIAAMSAGLLAAEF